MPASDIIASKRLDLSPAGIERAEVALLQLPQADCPLRHIFGPGVCVREITMPTNAIIIGHAHRFADVNIMLTGRLTLLEPDGSLREVKAPCTFLGQPGRKIAFIHETVIWQNAWATLVEGKSEKEKGKSQWIDLGTDVEAIEDFYLDKSPGWQADRAQRLALDRLARQPDRDSFAAFLKTYDYPADDVRRISVCESDQIPMPLGQWKFMVGASAIEGKGLLATADIAQGEYIGPARTAGKRTPIGRYANHSANPNAVMAATPEGDLILLAARAIRGCAGGQPGEEITVSYEQSIAANNASVIAGAKAKGNLCPPQP